MPHPFKSPQFASSCLGLFLVILVLVASGCLKKTVDESDSVKVTPVETPTDNPTAKPAWIAVELPADGKTPKRYTVMDTAGNVLPLVADYEITRMFDVGVVTPPFDSPYFFEYCAYEPNGYEPPKLMNVCGIISAAGEIVLSVDEEKVKRENEICRDTSRVAKTIVHEDGKFFFKVNYIGEAFEEIFSCEDYVPGIPEWRDDGPAPYGKGGRLMDLQGKPIPDSEISEVYNGDRVLVRYPRRTFGGSLCGPIGDGFDGNAFDEGSEHCELILLSENKTLNKVELKACGGKIDDLFPVMPADSGGLWGYMSPEGDMVIPAMFHHVAYFDDDQAIVRLSLEHAKKLCASEKKSPSSVNKAFLASCANGFANWEKTVEICSTVRDILPEDVEPLEFDDPTVASAALRCVTCDEHSYESSGCPKGNCWWTRPYSNSRTRPDMDRLGNESSLVDFGWTRINKRGQVVDRFDYSAEMIFGDILYRDDESHSNPLDLRPVYFEAIAAQYGYDCISRPFGEIAIFEKDDNFGIINMKMQEIAMYDGISVWVDDEGCRFFQFQDGVAAVKKDGLYGLINTKGEEIVKPQYEEFVDKGEYAGDFHFDGSFVQVKKGGLYGVINTKGEEIAKPQYEELYIRNEGLIYVKKDGLYGLINTQGNEIVKPQYDEMNRFDGGFARVKKGGLYGVINTKGEEIVKPQYDEVDFFYGGFARVKKGGLYGYIDTQSKEIVKPQFQEASEKFFANRAVIKQNGKCGYVDIRGNVVVKPQWDDCHSFVEASETARVSKMVNGNEEISYIYKNGSTVPEEYCLAPGVGDQSSLAKKIVRCQKLGQNLVELGDNPRILDDLNPGSPVDIRWEEGPKGEYRFVSANGDPLTPYRLKARPTKTYTGVSAFNFMTKTGDEYQGWVDAAGKILWPPGYNDPCTDTHGVVVWPKGSCVQ